MQNSYGLKDAQEYAWEHFAHHANQRLTLFNFFLILASILVTVAANLLTQDNPTYTLATIVFILIGLLSFVFFNLDKRAKNLFEDSAHILSKIEIEASKSLDNIELNIFCKENKKPIITYSKGFSFVFITFGILSLIGIFGSLHMQFI